MDRAKNLRFIEQLAEELKELEDKKALVEQKVKMVHEGKKQLAEVRSQFQQVSKALLIRLLQMKLNHLKTISLRPVKMTLDAEFLKHPNRVQCIT